MCVTFVCKEEMPTTRELASASRVNDDGAGLGWSTKDGKKHWVKGIMDPAEVEKIARGLKYPFIIHFRKRSEGLPDTLNLSHPFPLTAEVDLALKGSTDFPLLFQNGTMASWRSDLRDAALKSCKKLPDTHIDDWSDTRAIAWMLHHFGLSYINVLSGFGRLAILDTNTIWTSCPDEWYRPGSRGFIASNQDKWLSEAKFEELQKREKEPRVGVMVLRDSKKVEAVASKSSSVSPDSVAIAQAILNELVKNRVRIVA